jgi:prepilin-type N-terminal cleavage/methylation domain-containing protein
MDRLSRLPRRARRGGRREGFTLLEVIVAMGILAIGLLGVAAAQIHALHGGKSGRHTTDASAFAHTQIEQLQRMNFTDAALTATAGWVPAGGQAVQTTVQSTVGPIAEQNYTVQWRITDVVANQLKAVDVRVTWSEPNRPNRTFTISTVLHNDPRTSS